MELDLAYFDVAVKHTSHYAMGTLTLHNLLEVCYITYAIDFWFVPSDPLCFDKLLHCD